MIGFLQPLALFGLLAAAIPPILHLLARRHIPVVDFPAVTYLTETERRHSKQLRLHNLLLLLLRTLLIALIALAAGRPVTKVATGGSHEPTAVGVIVDNSLSSQSVVDGEWVMRSLLDRAWEVFEQTGEADLVWLMLADGLPRRVTRAEALVVLDTLTPWPLRLDLGRAVGNMAQVLSGEDLPREVVVFTDGQASAFSSSGRAFENIGEVPVLLWTPGETIPNRSIDSVRLEPPSWVAGGEVVVAVGGDEQEPSAVRVGIGERELARGVAAPGDHTILRGSSVALGWHAGFVELDADELRADDRRVFALRVTAPQAVAVSPTVGPFAVEGLAVLEMSGRVTRGEGVRIGTFDPASPAVVFPPADVADIGGLNRSLEILGIGWRFSDLVDGEWNVQGLDLLQQETVYRRWQLQGSGAVLVSVGGEPWIVRDKGVVIVASRLDPGWTTLPVGAAFIPFLDHLLNRYSARQEEVIEAFPSEPVEVPAGASALRAGDEMIPLPSEGLFSAPGRTGVYFVEDVEGDTIAALAVNHDPRESRLAGAPRSLIRSVLGPNVSFVDDGSLGRELFQGAGRFELAGFLLAAAMLIAALELFLSARGTSSGVAQEN